MSMAGSREPSTEPTGPGDHFWIKDAIIYELHIRAFLDSAGDGVGDIRGLLEKLDYLQDLGITALWLLPFTPSPLKDDGYDTSDYRGVHPAYGTQRDFQVFVREAHRRGIRVITELILNHTSDQHPWFQRARQSKPGSPWRDFYVWSDTPDRYRDARVIFKDFETSNWTWDPMARAYYWHRFYSHQPDLNYESPLVRSEISAIVDFWFDLGVDGLRIDAVPYLFEREGTSCENLPETHAYLKELRGRIDAVHPGRILLAEANQWPEEAAAYFGSGDECHMAFHFPLMPRLFMAVRMEDRFPILDILAQTPPIPDTCQWALFLRNHDELTLEMVTDEERDFMYRVYANEPRSRINLGIRRRLAPLLGNNRRRIELMNGLLFSLPGTPTIYYGEEIGMGDNVYLGDRNAVRTPMQWSADRNAGFSKANAQSLYLPVIVDPEYHYEAVNVEAQEKNPSSLLWWMRRLISVRKRHKVFGRGETEFLHPENRKVLAFLRRLADETVLVLANLSRFSQYAALDLKAHAGATPVEIFGGIRFPPIGDRPYEVTFGPHSFYWFSLEPRKVQEVKMEGPGPQVPEIPWEGTAESLLDGRGREAFEGILPRLLEARRTGQGQGRGLPKSTTLLDAIPLETGGRLWILVLAQAEFEDEDPRTFFIPLGVEPEDPQGEAPPAVRTAVFARLLPQGPAGGRASYLFDAATSPGFPPAILRSFAARQLRSRRGEVAPRHLRGTRKALGGLEAIAQEAASLVGRHDMDFRFGSKAVLRLHRQVEEGSDPEVEIGRFLAASRCRCLVPPFMASLEYRRLEGTPMTLGVLHGFMPSEGDAWQYTVDAVGRYFDRVLTQQMKVPPSEKPPLPGGSAGSLEADLPPTVYEILGTYLPFLELMGTRLAELHMALASGKNDPEFQPELFTPHFQRSLYQSLRNLTARTLRLLRRRQPVPEGAARVFPMEAEIQGRFREILQPPIQALRIRCHGDLRLGKILRTGKDIVLVGFGGELNRSLSERRLKRSPLRDGAMLIGSLWDAAEEVLGTVGGEVRRLEDAASLGPYAALWSSWAGAAFLRSYWRAAGDAPFLPKERKDLRGLMALHMLERAVSELSMDLQWFPVRIPRSIRRLLQVLEQGRD